MHKYRIFTEKKGFVFTNNLIFCIVLGIVSFLYFLQKYFFNWFLIPERNFQFVFLVPLFLGLFFLIFCQRVSYEPLKGTLETYLELHKDYIVIEEKQYFLDEIVTLEILNYDYKGDLNYAGKGNLNGVLSNGIGNLFIINFINGKSTEVNFQQDKENEIIAAKRELVNYYKEGKISFKSFVKVLGYDDSDLSIIEAIIKYNS